MVRVRVSSTSTCTRLRRRTAPWAAHLSHPLHAPITPTRPSTIHTDTHVLYTYTYAYTYTYTYTYTCAG